jgi:glycosyltransferase involved in cell wall biosynthesis
MIFLKTFDKPSTLLVVSSYPDPKTGIKDLDAVAWHSQKTLRSMASTNQKIVVFSEISSQTKAYKDGPNILVLPLWHKGQALSFFKALTQIFKFKQAKNVLFQFEFNIFGGILPVLLIPFFLLFFRLTGKKIIFEIHQVITDISELKTHLNLKNRLFQRIFNFGLLNFYKTIGLLSNQIVVLEQELKNRLSSFVPEGKINFIPISTIKKRKINQNLAKLKLGFNKKDFVIMSFGFINWYKGSDWLVKAFSATKHKNSKLILAGGPSPTLKDKKYYQNYYSKLKKSVSKNKNISISGFIPDEKIYLYFSAADLVLLPYRVFMSSSGPLSLAFSYQKPVLLSKPLIKNYINSLDFNSNLSKLNLDQSDISFSLNLRYFSSKISQSQKKLHLLTKFSSLMLTSRNEQNSSQKYLSLINNPEIQSQPHFSLIPQTN